MAKHVLDTNGAAQETREAKRSEADYVTLGAGRNGSVHM